MTPGNRVAQLYPRALGNHFSRLLRHDGLQWVYALTPVTTRDVPRHTLLQNGKASVASGDIISAAGGSLALNNNNNKLLTSANHQWRNGEQDFS
jgi:hypothetical protein